MIRKTLLLTAVAMSTLGFRPLPAVAIPVFAHRSGLSCQACHTIVPHLTPFGEAFLTRGYRLPIDAIRSAFPVAIKANLAYSSEPDGSGLPKAVVDEIEVLTGGSVGRTGSYFAEGYLIDGGRPGSIRDAWYARTIGAVQATVGQFTLPLPVDPETFRETSAHLALYDQTVGTNPFHFFDPKQGVSVRTGSNIANATFSALVGHDKQSGLPTSGVDRMVSVQATRGSYIASAYRYDGERRLTAGGDRFWRQGLALAYASDRLRVDATLQTGNDAGPGIRSSGGFLQVRYAFGNSLAATVRYDGTNDTQFARSLLVGASRRLSRNTRLSIEDVIAHTPQTKHALNAAYLFAY